MAEAGRTYAGGTRLSAGLPARQIIRLVVGGQVQGVGFRPFVYRLAKHHQLDGEVRNCLGEVEIIVAGMPSAVADFSHALVASAPPLARPHIESVSEMTPRDFDGFHIVASRATTTARICLPPDYFMCDDCLKEQQDPRDRRYRYPFINCTQCGPRYTLIEKLPYDRVNTSMAKFVLCDACRAEYTNPLDRRFHAEPIACPDCGPQVLFRSSDGQQYAREAALSEAVAALHAEQVVAVKGVGGYHLMCDAQSAHAVRSLRRRKRRPHKPLAVMVPRTGSGGLAWARKIAMLSRAEATALLEPMRPIVLCRKNADAVLAGDIAPGLAEIGLFLPYSPLHQLLLEDFGGPLVATSGNLSGEPVLTSINDAEQRLACVADAFLHHDRPIVRPADDPVYRRTGKRMHPLRIGRGSAPREMQLPWPQPLPTLAVGGQMKGAIALSWEDRVVVSPHIGEMHSPRSLEVLQQLSADLQRLYKVRAARIACDAHPGYTTHQFARKHPDLPFATVWHHRAHASALAAECEAPGAWLVFTWDGVGLGEDGSLWGGEALYGAPGRWRRVASLRQFHLPGGERAGRQPWRSAAAVSWACGQDRQKFADADGIAYQAWQKRLNCPATSAAGRLFDAAAFFVCGMAETSYEAQGPMELESLCTRPGEVVPLPLAADRHGVARSDWQPLIARLADASVDATVRAEMFHTSMANVILAQARFVRERKHIDQVGLTGGVFQNRVLCEQAVDLLESDGFSVRIAQQLPCNDAALCFGQAAEIAALSLHRDT